MLYQIATLGTIFSIVLALFLGIKDGIEHQSIVYGFSTYFLVALVGVALTFLVHFLLEHLQELFGDNEHSA